MKQSKLRLITCRWQEGRKNARKQGTVGFSGASFLSHSCSTVDANRLLFDTQMKTAVYQNGFSVFV